MNALEKAIRAYGEACHRSGNSDEMDARLAEALDLAQAACHRAIDECDNQSVLWRCTLCKNHDGPCQSVRRLPPQRLADAPKETSEPIYQIRTNAIGAKWEDVTLEKWVLYTGKEYERLCEHRIVYKGPLTNITKEQFESIKWAATLASVRGLEEIAKALHDLIEIEYDYDKSLVGIMRRENNKAASDEWSDE